MKLGRPVFTQFRGFVTNFCIDIELRLHVLFVMLGQYHEAVTWTTTISATNRLKTFKMCTYLRVLKTTWNEHVTKNYCIVR